MGHKGSQGELTDAEALSPRSMPIPLSATMLASMQYQHRQATDMPTCSGKSSSGSDIDFDSESSSDFGASFFQGAEGPQFPENPVSPWDFGGSEPPNSDSNSNSNLNSGPSSLNLSLNSGRSTPVEGGADLQLESESEESPATSARGLPRVDACPATAGVNLATPPNDTHLPLPPPSPVQSSSILTYAIHLFLSLTVVAVLLPTMRILRGQFDTFYISDVEPPSWLGNFEFNSSIRTMGSTVGSVIEEQTYGVCGLREDLRFAASFLLGCLITYIVRGGQLERRGDMKVLDILALLL
eukprot:CAMPEP_0206562634 /NCGR_PEP_ID=MMETSP0325_2-20121206/22369_1 /ASSEMBLY_ACC=CAM_ASM_000347 /TAXON_ID=2866 /ORGANISM="Crypthecodinium cohnii, Strain Seligo" /LENGTH=296 /DNA_ID=CAMNT_0054064889 /DNA_START=686 /DNA_END=1576 /DNA_ORIENTATION=+